MALPNTNTSGVTAVKRLRLWYALLIGIVAIFCIRLFYLQVIRYDYYRTAALSDQLKQYEIPPSRGVIKAYDGSSVLPIVLNQKLYTVYADPTFIKNPEQVAEKLVPIIGGKLDDRISQLKTKKTRYVILAKKVSPAQRDKILALQYPGIGTETHNYRTYPQGSLAAQVLGFVNDDGKGKYGIEQALNKELSGTPGQLKAITDARGIPLASSKNNIEIAPQNGKDVVLTIDVAMQHQAESILADGLKNAHSSAGSVIIMDPRTGAIKAMADAPTFNPAEYYKVEDGSVFQNGAVSNPIETGSIMKTLTTVAAIDQGVVNKDTTYSDPGFWLVDGFRIQNVEEEGGAGTRSVNDIINLSLNTGATWELMQMGGGKLDAKGRQAWYDYLTKHFLLGKATGIEQGYEADGYIPSPEDNGAGINLTYANMAFGQALTATPLQMGAAISAVVNGGTYFQPHLVDSTDNADGTTTKTKSVVKASNIIKPGTLPQFLSIMEYSVQHHNFNPNFDTGKYQVGGKTGTAQIAKQGGGYRDDAYNGTYLGYVGGNDIQYVIVVFVKEPHVGTYAGIGAAQPIFSKLAHMLIDNSYVVPKH
ncbi:MAG: putative Peptidoglycan glycosyltransferase [Candidatus Saccharibacteria bacterium]|nr:putative Peptidoglycan glycosyltransferase [Candidatus Saccharibacteria bacterium]